MFPWPGTTHCKQPNSSANCCILVSVNDAHTRTTADIKKECMQVKKMLYLVLLLVNISVNYFFSFSFYTRMRNKYCVPLLDSKALNNLIHEILRPGQGLMRPFFKHKHITREVCRTILVKQLPKLKERFYSELFFLFFFFLTLLWSYVQFVGAGGEILRHTT